MAGHCWVCVAGYRACGAQVTPETHRKCIVCGEVNPLDRFAPHSNRGTARRSECRECRGKRQRAAKKERVKNAPPCSVPGCGRGEYAHGMCEGHRRQILRYGKVKTGTRLTSPMACEPRWTALMDAFSRYIDAESDADFEKATWAVKEAACRFASWRDHVGRERADAEFAAMLKVGAKDAA